MRVSIPSLAPARLGAALAVVLLAAACAQRPPPPPPVLQPPAIRLDGLGALGMIDFAGAGADGLSPAASRQFLASIQSAQPGVPVLELGPREQVLAAVGAGEIDPDTIRAIGRKYGLDAVLVGELQTREIQPHVTVRALDSLSASAELEGVLDARILETKRGATLWTTSASSRVQLAHVELSPWGPGDVHGSSPEQARAALLRRLVERATDDFHPHWVQP